MSLHAGEAHTVYLGHKFSKVISTWPGADFWFFFVFFFCGRQHRSNPVQVHWWEANGVLHQRLLRFLFLIYFIWSWYYCIYIMKRGGGKCQCRGERMYVCVYVYLYMCIRIHATHSHAAQSTMPPLFLNVNCVCVTWQQETAGPCVSMVFLWRAWVFSQSLLSSHLSLWKRG